ncbi:unnamed protein product [Adineta steineri]|uniref:poly(ADP-ribose) glycohydrolase n=1 Tax=Adineta steineri TaxID=433720 RepID=A0A813NB65_9BILA|nr:unnamed protein product [Adineta steineri]CAF1079172.1 unnamed protein product [Adineta steineri]
MARRHIDPPQDRRQNIRETNPNENTGINHNLSVDDAIHDDVTSLNSIVNSCSQPPSMKDMEKIQDQNCKFMIAPINDSNNYHDIWNIGHIRMPCSPQYMTNNGQPMWQRICLALNQLKQKCENKKANFRDLKTPPLLRQKSNYSLTMSQQQAASLLACSFFCLFPTVYDEEKQHENFQEPNFHRLYQKGPPENIEKLKCILNYFRRITETMPSGVITIQRYELPKESYPNWSNSKTGLSQLCLTKEKKIEDIKNVLQVDFANKYIGGGVLGSGCVQEEIRFSISPEMLVSLLVCEVMKDNECIFLIGCERYSSYTGYANSFQFAGDYRDTTPKDNWGRKWCHLVAMDAIYFRDPSTQYEKENVDRELIKAYASFRPLEKEPGFEFGIATGNWGCGVFNGDKELKAIIQLMAASEARRPLIYAAFHDENLFYSFIKVYEYLKVEKATVGILYKYLVSYPSRLDKHKTLFNYILETPPSSIK